MLDAVRIASENAGELRPAVERALVAFGDPLAVVRDLGAAGAKEVAACRRRDIPDLLGHFHFLAALGHKLLDGHYGMRRISRSKLSHQLGPCCASPARTGRCDPVWRPPALGPGRGGPQAPALSLLAAHLAFARRCERFPA